MRSFLVLFFALTSLSGAGEFLPGVKRILFLGDSITYAGQYVDGFTAFLITSFPERHFEVIDCGLPSETVSGLSEEGHADGKFPRPDLHERLDRVLALVKPDLVFACYGMNCGIYLPLDDERFRKYQQGIELLCDKVKSLGASIILITPPVFDSHGAEGFDYDSVLTHYSAWMLAFRNRGIPVVDGHGAMRSYLDEKRLADPVFTFSPDKVHPNLEGHFVLSKQIVLELSTQQQFEVFSEFLKSSWLSREEGRKFMEEIRLRRSILSDSYLSAAGHKRPGMNTGLPLQDAKTQAAELSRSILEHMPQP